MAPRIYKVIQTWPRRSGITADAVQFQWVFGSNGLASADTDATSIQAKMDDFWNVETSSGSAPSDWMAPSLSLAADAISFAFTDITDHLDGSDAGAPFAYRTITSSSTGGSFDYPEEICTVLSYHRDYATDVEFDDPIRPRARDRGRLYFGPLKVAVADFDAVTLEVRIAEIVQDTFVYAAQDLMGADDATVWVQWSRANASVDAVTVASMDNAFDIQRRRGNAPTSRVSTPL